MVHEVRRFTKKLVWLALVSMAGGCAYFYGGSVKEHVAQLDPNKPVSVRREAVIWLGDNTGRLLQSDKERLVKVLGAVLENDEDTLTRCYAATAIAKIGVTSGVKYLRSALKDRQYMVRWDAVKALARMKAVEARGDLTRVARNDPSVDVRVAAVQALGELKCRESIPDLIGFLSDDEESVVLAAQRSLVKATGRDFGLNQEAWRNWWEKGAPPEKPKPAAKQKRRWLRFWRSKPSKKKPAQEGKSR